MRIALTGGAGFVGSAIARALYKSGGHEVCVIDDMSTGRVVNFAFSTTPSARPMELYRVDAAAWEYDAVEAIIHCAALPDVKGNWVTENAREEQWQRNTELTRRILDRAPKGAKFTLISTCSVYGGGRVDEHTTLRSTSPYAASKIAAEALVQSYTEAGRIDGRIVRLVNVVGTNYQHGHIADFVAMAKGPDRRIKALDDGVKRKTFVHADDVAELVLRSVVVDGFPDLVNAVSEVEWSWRDSVEVMRAMVAHDPARSFSVECIGRPSGWVGDPAELKVETLFPNNIGKRSIVNGVTEALVSLGWLEAPKGATSEAA